MKVLLFLPKGFEHMESSVFIDVLGWARHTFSQDVQLVTAGFTKTVVSTFGVPVVVDMLIDEISADDYDALAIPGGFTEFGFLEEAHDERFLDLIREFDRKKKLIASVCMAGISVGKSGILEGRRATTYHLCGSPKIEMLKGYGADTVRERVVVDGNVITSCGPETAVWVAFQLLEMLAGPSAANQVKTAMGYTFDPGKSGESVK